MPGRYVMHDAVHLKSGVTLQGSGPETVLWKPPSVASRTIWKLGYGHYDVAVAEPHKFRVGQGVWVTDDTARGFLGTVATITYIEGRELGLSDCLHSDILERRGGRVVTVHPIISAVGVRDACVTDLLIDGNRAENEYLNGCRGGGVYLLKSHNIRLERVTVRAYNGDGFSYQQCTSVALLDCTAEGNAGYGAHPGSGSVGSILRGCTFRDNGSDGIYYCLRVSDSLCEGNVMAGNGQDGISIGHRDERIIIRANRVVGNRRSGIWYREDETDRTGHDTVIADNEFAGNGPEEGAVHIRLNARAESVTIWGNRVLDGELLRAAKPEYLAGVSFAPPSRTTLDDEASLRRRSRRLGVDPTCLTFQIRPADENGKLLGTKEMRDII
jgi:hypothetical protein